MAATFTKKASTLDVSHADSLLGMHIVVGTINLGVYATGGIALTGATFGGTTSNTIYSLVPATATEGVYEYSWDLTAGKMQAFTNADGLEVANATDLSDAGEECHVLAVLAIA
jgi:hypothetical protein